MTTQEVAEAVEEWVVDLISDLEDKTYDYHASKKSKPFPDAAIEVDEMRQGATPGEVGMPEVLGAQNGWEQVIFRSWTVRILLMVDSEPPATAEETIRGYADTLVDGLVASRTMGDRVMWTSYSTNVSYTPPFVEYEDGARGRLATVEVTVGEAVAIDD